MRTRQKSIVLMAMILSLIMLMAIPALASKSGGGAEGANPCDAVPLQNDPPVWTGWLHFIWIWGNGELGSPFEYDGVYFQGDIVQNGKSGCSCSFPVADPWFYGTMYRTEFDNMSPQGLVGICQQIGGLYQDDSGQGVYYCKCKEEGITDNFSISTVNRLQRLGPDEWYGYVEIMRMKEKK